MQEDDRRLDCCLNCTDCNAACPVMKVVPSFPGPKALGPDLERVRKEGIRCETPMLDFCSGCSQCELACPNGVNVSEILSRAKLKQSKRGRVAWRDALLARPDLLGRIGSTVPGLANLMLRIKPNRALMAACLKIGSKRNFPQYRSPNVSIKKNGASLHTIFFPGCFIRHNHPSLMQTVVNTLQTCSSVEISHAACCGVPALANGQASQLRHNLRANVNALCTAAKNGTCIVTACTSCSHMFKVEYPRLLRNDPELARQASFISEHTYDLAEFLIEFAGKLDVRPVNLRIAYHAPCHLKGQGIGRPWLRILRAIPGIQVEEMAAECCGMAGTFGFKQEKYQTSMDIGEELFAAIRAYRPDLAVSECGTCRMQIEHGTSMEALHPAEILHSALGLTSPHKGAD